MVSTTNLTRREALSRRCCRGGDANEDDTVTVNSWNTTINREVHGQPPATETKADDF